MTDYSMNEKMIIIQYAIKKYENEETVIEKLKSVLSEKDIQRSIDTLIGTQKVRRIGPEILQNNESHTELPELPENLKPAVMIMTPLIFFLPHSSNTDATNVFLITITARSIGFGTSKTLLYAFL